jgi:hypothetical protein
MPARQVTFSDKKWKKYDIYEIFIKIIFVVTRVTHERDTNVTSVTYHSTRIYKTHLSCLHVKPRLPVKKGVKIQKLV